MLNSNNATLASLYATDMVRYAERFAALNLAHTCQYGGAGAASVAQLRQIAVGQFEEAANKLATQLGMKLVAVDVDPVEPAEAADFCGEVPALQSALVEGARLP